MLIRNIKTYKSIQYSGKGEKELENSVLEWCVSRLAIV